MPNLTVVIPVPLVAELTVIAEALLTARGIDFSTMTATQKGQRYIAELLKDEIINARRGAAVSVAQTSLLAAQMAAITAANDAETAAKTAVTGITG